MRAWLTVALALVRGIAAAQDAAEPPPAPVVVNVRQVQPQLPAPLAAVPDGRDAWVLQVTTTGGVMGTGSRAGNFAVTSEGRITCDVSDCAPSVPRAELSRLRDRLARVDASHWPGVPPVAEQLSFCRDCLRTTLTLRRREGDVVTLYAASWDPSQRVAEPLRELAIEMKALVGRR